jgi:hypothetical protein
MKYNINIIKGVLLKKIKFDGDYCNIKTKPYSHVTRIFACGFYVHYSIMPSRCFDKNISPTCTFFNKIIIDGKRCGKCKKTFIKE